MGREECFDTLTGEISQKLQLPNLLLAGGGGVIAGCDLYPHLAALASDVRADEGWTLNVVLQRRMSPHTEKRVSGVMYVPRLTYRHAKIRDKVKGRYRPGSIKWTVLNLELFTDPEKLTTLQDILAAARSLVDLAKARKIKPRPSPGAFGSALLRASPLWINRRPAPFFISDMAREHLPGNYYALSHRIQKRRKFGETLDHAYYIDQESSHHKIVDSIPLPHPEWLRGRGPLRAVEHERTPCWIDNSELGLIKDQVGLLCCLMECDTIPVELAHLYPPWSRTPGKHVRWVWTPELRLLDRRTRLRHVCAGLTSHRADLALWEYADFALGRPRLSAEKAALLAAYGMLATRTDRPVESYTVHGRSQPPRSEAVTLPLLGRTFRSTVERVRRPSVQNVVARGVIEAECRTRSIEYARQLESEGIPVAQIYADGLLAVCDQVPMFVPEHWRVVESLTRVSSPMPNQIISDQLVRLPGFDSRRREAYVRQTLHGQSVRQFEPQGA